MKKLIAWPATWSLYWAGHVVSLPLNRWDCFAWLYPMYNHLMGWSYNIQYWADVEGPWVKPK